MNFLSRFTSALAGKGNRAQLGVLAVPPVEMRQMVGPTDVEAFDNPGGSLVYSHIDKRHYREFFDFGCGCGRVARQLIQQEPRPGRYLGMDIHRGMIQWCQENLAPAAPGFEFMHHDVFNESLNPGPDKPMTAPFPAEDRSFTMVNAHSVFTHLTQMQAEFYLGEAARILKPDGVLNGSWFLFEKSEFPMMQEFQNALYINIDDPSNAVIYDKDWLRQTAAGHGLTIVKVIPPAIRGFQWFVVMTPTREGLEEAGFPLDDAEHGLMRPPDMPVNAHKIGLDIKP